MSMPAMIINQPALLKHCQCAFSFLNKRIFFSLSFLADLFPLEFAKEIASRFWISPPCAFSIYIAFQAFLIYASFLPFRDFLSFLGYFNTGSFYRRGILVSYCESRRYLDTNVCFNDLYLR